MKHAPFLPRKKADVTAAVPERDYADFLAEARVRQSGAGLAGPLLSVTDEQPARADADIGSWKERARGRKCAPGFRLTPYGLERISE